MTINGIQANYIRRRIGRGHMPGWGFIDAARAVQHHVYTPLFHSVQLLIRPSLERGRRRPFQHCYNWFPFSLVPSLCDVPLFWSNVTLFRLPDSLLSHGVFEDLIVGGTNFFMNLDSIIMQHQCRKSIEFSIYSLFIVLQQRIFVDFVSSMYGFTFKKLLSGGKGSLNDNSMVRVQNCPRFLLHTS
jgi:hypothetical protein